jgi:hypothetical protein
VKNNYDISHEPMIQLSQKKKRKKKKRRVPKLFQGQNDRGNCSSQCRSTKRYSIEVTYAIRLRKVRRNSVIKTKQKKKFEFRIF